MAIWPAVRRRYHSTVHASASSQAADAVPSRAAAGPSRHRPSAESASCGCIACRLVPARAVAPLGRRSRSTIHATGRASSSRGTEVPCLAKIRGIAGTAARRAPGSRTAAPAHAATAAPRAGCGWRSARRRPARACSRAPAGPLPSRRRRSHCRRVHCATPMLVPAARRAPIGCRHQFRAALAAAVRIVPAHRLGPRDRPRATRGSRSTCRW